MGGTQQDPWFYLDVTAGVLFLQQDSECGTGSGPVVPGTHSTDTLWREKVSITSWFLPTFILFMMEAPRRAF